MRTPVRYFVPGPAWVDPAVLQAMVRPVAPHRAPEIQIMWDAIGTRLQSIFRTDRDVLISTSSATFALEAALVSLKPERLLSIVNGAFSERWFEIARSLGVTASRFDVAWGQSADPEALRSRIEELDPDAVTVVHCETSTGALNPVAEISKVVHENNDALVLVDAVSSLAGVPVETDAWDLDLVVTASQKALALPPGLAFFSASERFWKRVSNQDRRGFYSDFLRYRDKHRGRGPITTPALPQIFALDLQLDRILEEGIEVRWRRHGEMLNRTRSWAERRGIEYASAGGSTSPTVSCLRIPSNVHPDALHAGLAERRFVVAAGYGKWKETTFRIGHMGDVHAEDLVGLFEVLDGIFKSRQ